MTRAQFFADFVLKFYSPQTGIDAVLKDAQTAWEVIGAGVA